MSEPGKPPDFSNLTENLSQQQAKISALKELVRQSESQHGKNTASAQEKVKNIAQRLSNLKSKTSRSKRSSSEFSEEYGISNIEEEEPTSSLESSINTSLPNLYHNQRARSETPGSEKITLLRKQMEVNRMKMAERESKSKEIEQMVTQLKSKLETSQMSLEKSVELGRSMGDLSNLSMIPLHSQSVSDVSHTPHSFNLEVERIKFLERRIRQLEEKLSDKENLPESEKVERLEHKIIDLEENLREKESIIEARTKAVSLLSENLTKKKKDVVDSLEETKQEMFKMQVHFIDTEKSYKDEVDRLNRVINERSDEIQNLNEKCGILEKSRYDLTIENSDLKTKLEDVQDYSTKISELNKLNETLQKQISQMESQRYEFVTDGDIAAVEESKDDSIDWQGKVKSLEELLQTRGTEIEHLEENLQEKTVEYNVISANLSVLEEKYNSLRPKSLFSSDEVTNEDSQAEIAKLKQQLDDANKNMIKTKVKVKQLQKQVDSFKKGDTNQEVVRLTEEIQTLTQRISELEEDKGNTQWQEWGNEAESELEKKMKVLEMTCQNQTTAIQLLEEQKIDMTEDLQNAKGNSELTTKLLELEEKVKTLKEEKENFDAKLTRYVNENSELHERIEKLSKGSSAESIEMVNLSAQENEEYQKAIGSHIDEDLGPEISQELNESLKSLREESSELMSKIELFTIERREVLDKLDTLTLENQVLVGSIESIREEKVVLEHENEKLKQSFDQTESLLSELQNEKEELAKKVSELNEHRSKLQEEINTLVKQGLDASLSKSTGDAGNEVQSLVNKDDCEKLLKQLDTEIANFNKNKDKNQQKKISKKVSENAKSIHAMMTNLLVDYYKTLDDCKQLREDLEKVKVSLSKASVAENENEEVKHLRKKLQETEAKLLERNEEFDKIQVKLEVLQQTSLESASADSDDLKLSLDQLTAEMGEKNSLVEKLQEMIDDLTRERDRCEAEVQNQRSLVNDLRKEFDQLCADVKVNNQRLNEKSSELDQLQREFDMRLKTSTNEVEVLKTLVAEQKQLLIDSYVEHELDINQKIKEINDYENQVKQMEVELSALRKQNLSHQETSAQDLNVEISTLKDLLEENSKLLDEHKEEMLHKQETIDTLNNQIIDLYKALEENSNKIIEKEDELQYLQEINENNREEMRKLHDTASELNKIVVELKKEVLQKSHENQLLQQKAVQEVKALELKNKEQLDKMKKYAANLKKKQAHCTELEEKLSSVGVTDVTDAANELKAQIIQYKEQLSIIKMENNKLNNSLQKSEAPSNDELTALKLNLDQQTYLVEKQASDINKLQQQLEDSFAKNDEVEESLFNCQSQLQKLETEKMRLEASVSSSNEVSNQLKIVTQERDTLHAKLQELDAKEKPDDKKKMDKLKAAVVQLKHKLADKKKEVDELTEELNKLKVTGGESSVQETILKSQLQELQDMSSKIIDETKNAYEHDIGMLRQQLADLEASNRLLNEDKQRKLSLEGQLETFEMTNVQLRNRIEKLEESLAALESDKNSLHREKLSLAAELEEKVNEFVHSEEALLRRANDLIEQDALNGQKLRETESENFQLSESIKELTADRQTLQQKLSSLETQFSINFERSSQQISMLEGDNLQLRQHIEQLVAEMKKNQTTHQHALAAKHAEIDEMESDLSSQLQKVDTEKKSLQEALEKASDQIVDFQDEVVRLKDNTHTLEQAKNEIERELSWLKLQSENYTQDQLENEQLRMQLMQSETEAENLRNQNDNLIENQSVEVSILRQQIKDLETMRSQVSQNQTDDQVMLQNENVKLKELLVEKENQIQQKTIQLQMVSTFDVPFEAVSDPFANLSSAPPLNVATEQDQRALEAQLQQAKLEITELQESRMLINMELDVQSAKLQDLLQENRLLRDKAKEMQSTMDNLIGTNVEMDSSLNRSTDDEKLNLLESELIEKNQTIQRLQEIVNKYESPAQSVSSVHTVTPAPFSTSMLFGDDPQTSAGPLFDDPFASVIPPQEVVEEFITPKKAYLCYDKKASVETQTNEDWLQAMEDKVYQIYQLQIHVQDLEQRLFEQNGQLELQAQNTAGYAQKIRALESSVQLQAAGSSNVSQYFEPTTAATSQSSSSVVPLATNESMAALEIEDGWGWTSSEAEIQQQVQQQQTSLLSPRSDLEVRLQEQRDIVEKLEQEKNGLNEELATSRENSKKMMKKLKEYQTKLKDLEAKSSRKSSSLDSNDMDLVIQEELNSQIQKLEAKLKEFNADREKEQQEKESMAKRVDVLIAANERLLENKERQDNQMELYQLKIRDLNQKLQNLEEWENPEEKVEPAAQMSPMKENQAELYKKIQELTDQLKDLHVDFEESQALLEEERANNQILELRISQAAQAKNISKDDESERLNNLLEESLSDREALKQKISTKDQEIRELISKLDQLSNESSNIKTILEDLSNQIQLKTNENQHLNQRLQNLATNNEDLSRERQKYNDTVEQDFRKQAEDLEQQLQALHAELQYKNSQIVEMNDKMNELALESDATQSLIEAVKAKDDQMEALRTQLLEVEEKLQSSTPVQTVEVGNIERLQELEKTNISLNQEKSQMEHELEVLNDQVLASLEFEDKMKNAVFELDAKNIEIQMLKASLQKMSQLPDENIAGQIASLQQEKNEIDKNMKAQIDLLNAQWSQAVEQRGNEVATSWKQHLELREAEFAEIEETLKKKLAVKPIASDDGPQEKDDDTITKMKSIMENQEVEIVSLKEQLAIRSAEYASLSARVDPYHQMSTSMNVSQFPPSDNERVPRSELDLALYMLHQRDMRLEEMTMELVRLLEERDQLQLRLSNSLRQVEDGKRTFSAGQEPQGSSDISKVHTPEKSPNEALENEEKLLAKLSELNTIHHSKDKAITDEREQRFMENISFLQRDIANIPQEAAARIVASSSDQGHSPSSVLMNWILGKGPDST